MFIRSVHFQNQLFSLYSRFGVVPVFDEKKQGMTVEQAVGSRRVAEGKRSLWPTRTSLLSAIQVRIFFDVKGSKAQRT